MEEMRQNTKLESEDAEFLVPANLLTEGITCFKAYVNFPDYDLIAVNADKSQTAKIQVKSRWAIDYDRSFPIKNFECDFVVHVALNRGYRFREKTTKDDSGIQEPVCYVFPVDFVKKAQNIGDTWGKVTITNIPNFEQYINNWGLIVEFLKQ